MTDIHSDFQDVDQAPESLARHARVVMQRAFLFAKAPPTGKGGLLNVTVIQK